jgi:hypothetical protein
LSIGFIARCSTPSIRLHAHRVVLRLDVDVGSAALQRGEQGRVHQADDRAGIRRQLVNRERLVAGLVLVQDLHLEAFGGLLEHALRALALLQDGLDGRRRADAHPDQAAQLHANLVDGRQIARVGHDDLERLPVAPVRHERVPQHQIGGDAPEQSEIRMEVVEVDVFELIARGQEARPHLLGGMVNCPAFGFDIERVGLSIRRGGHTQLLSDDRLNSGM